TPAAAAATATTTPTTTTTTTPSISSTTTISSTIALKLKACDSGMEEIAGSCYSFHNTVLKTAYEAEMECPVIGPGRYLASFASQSELDTVFQYFAPGGGRPALAIWATDASIGVPSSGNGCVVIAYGSVLRSEDCSITHSFLCEADMACDSGMHEIAGSCYSFDNTVEKTAYEAEMECPVIGPGRYLASFGSQTELDTVFQYFSPDGGRPALAIWATNASIGVPSSDNGCVVIAYGSVLRSEDCSITHKFLCETDMEVSTTVVTEAMTTFQMSSTSSTLIAPTTAVAVVTIEPLTTTSQYTTTSSTTRATSVTTTSTSTDPTTPATSVSTTSTSTDPTTPATSVTKTSTSTDPTTPATSVTTTSISTNPTKPATSVTTTSTSTDPTTILSTSTSSMTTNPQTSVVTTESPPTTSQLIPYTPTLTSSSTVTRNREYSFTLASAGRSLKEPSLIRTLDKIRTPLHCAVKCSSLEGCHVFTYSSANQKCYLGAAGGMDNLQNNMECNTYKMTKHIL
ncbi:cell wall protein DAN4-like, partial [Strongylocentrotus purpuratus]|uniref:C-type lectin domain-containing protein n=1 Tax=Strongylocentrotus purpuratus TaxID=7668 RepID=A0A7M7NIU3_STRPU